MKKIFKTIVLLFTIILLLCGCSKEERIKEITFDEFKEKIANKETFAVYVGNDNCSHCISYRPILEKVLDDYNITIYHVDNSKLDNKEYAEFRTYINISGTPTVAFITNGEEETTLNRITGEVSREATIERFKSNDYIK